MSETLFSLDDISSLRNFAFTPPAEYSYASHQYQIIMEQIYEFEQGLDNEHEVALKLCNFGQQILLNVTDIGYCDPNLMLYYGTVNGKESQLIQHVNQISFLLTSVPKSEPNKPPKRIGFIPEQNS